MNNEPTPTDELLARYLSGETDRSENAQVENWISASEENRAYFESLKKTWEQTKPANAEMNFDTNAAWSRMKVRMNASEEKVVRPARNYSRIAASVALFLIVTVALTWYLQPTTPIVQPLAFTSGNAVTHDTLPDGSIITLNKNSRLTYPSAFTGSIREVTLTGEAFFEVHKDAAHPFIIHTGQMDVKVLGTSFNVRAYPKSDSVRVSVKTGKVQCFAANDTAVLLPGEMVMYNVQTKKLYKAIENDPNTLAYRSHIFRFKNTRLSDAIRELNEVYGASIQLKNDQLGNCIIGKSDFNDQPIDKIVHVICDLFDLSVQEKNNTFILDGKGCN